MRIHTSKAGLALSGLAASILLLASGASSAQVVNLTAAPRPLAAQPFRAWSTGPAAACDYAVSPSVLLLASGSTTSTLDVTTSAACTRSEAYP